MIFVEVDDVDGGNKFFGILIFGKIRIYFIVCVFWCGMLSDLFSICIVIEIFEEKGIYVFNGSIFFIFVVFFGSCVKNIFYFLIFMVFLNEYLYSMFVVF